VFAGRIEHHSKCTCAYLGSLGSVPTNNVVVSTKEFRKVKLTVAVGGTVTKHSNCSCTYLGSLGSMPTNSVVVSPKEPRKVRLQLLLLVLLATTANVAVFTLAPWTVHQQILLL
jgi:hypothetical protein